MHAAGFIKMTNEFTCNTCTQNPVESNTHVPLMFNRHPLQGYLSNKKKQPPWVTTVGICLESLSFI